MKIEFLCFGELTL